MTTAMRRLAAIAGWWVGVPPAEDDYLAQGVLVTHQPNRWGTDVRTRVDYRLVGRVCRERR